MLRDAAESHDGPEELIEPLKGTFLGILIILSAFLCARLIL